MRKSTVITRPNPWPSRILILPCLSHIRGSTADGTYAICCATCPGSAMWNMSSLLRQLPGACAFYAVSSSIYCPSGTYDTLLQVYNVHCAQQNTVPFVDPETGLQALRTLFLLLLLLLFLLLSVLRLFHFTTDRHQTSHTHWWQHYPQPQRVWFSS